MQDDPIALTTWFETNMSQLEQLTLLVRGQLSELQRATLVALITQDVHARDIVDEMKKNNVSSTFEFAWQQ